MANILIVSTLEASPWGGSEEIWYMLGSLLQDRGHQIGIDRIEWPQPPAKLQELIAKGARHFPRPNPHVVSSPLNIGFRLRNKLFNLNYTQNLEQAKPDYVILSAGGTFDPIILAYSRVLLEKGIPYIVISQYTPEFVLLDDAERAAYRSAFLGAQHCYFVSGRNRQVSEKALATELPNAVLIYSPAEINLEFNGAWPVSQTARMAMAARLDIYYKGQDIVLEVLGSAKWTSRNWQLDVYGVGQHEQYLKELAAFYGIGDRVIFKGFSQRVEDIWAENQILVMPSRSEGTPISLIQACSYARAAVVTDVGGNAELVEHGVNGFVADAPNARCMDEALEAAFAAQDRWEEMGRVSQQRVRGLYEGKSYLQVLDCVLNAVRN